MPITLKHAIVSYVFSNNKVFNLHNATTDKFKLYIFDTEGEWLIGGKQVSEFISHAIKLVEAYNE